jgi:hypothetical protein
MLFSVRARVNGPAFLFGWVVALAAVSTIVYVVSHDGNVGSSSTAADSVSWGKIVLGVVFLVLARRSWRNRPAPGSDPSMPKWMARVDTLSPLQAAALGAVLAAANPKNLILTMGSAAGLAQLGLSTSDAIVATAVFVLLGSVTIAGPVFYARFGGERARASLDSAKAWLSAHNAAVTGALFLVFGVDLIAKGLPPLT